MTPVGPIETVSLFPELHAQLIDLLKGVAAEEWERPTACPGWSVKDLTAHLLDTQTRRLTFQRDRLPSLRPEQPINSYDDLVDFINELNRQWIVAARRIGPNLLIEFLALVGPQLCEFFKTLDPDQRAAAAVAWAGETVSANWFDLAREYTEQWAHQQQLREALGRPGLTGRRLLYPVLDTFMRALPHTYRQVEAAEGTGLAFTLTGPAGGDWALLREQGQWRLFYGRPPQPAAAASLDQDTAWRLFTKGISPTAARGQTRFEGDEALASGILNMVSMMA